MASPSERSGWKAKLVGGPFDSGKPRDLMSTEPLDQPPATVNVYRCECCNAAVIVAPGMHPHEHMLGPATVYRLDEVQPPTAVYLHDDLAGDALHEHVSHRERPTTVLTGVLG